MAGLATITGFSSNVILAKARAMYGRRLTDADFAALLNCRSVADVFGYLKQHEGYRQAFADIHDVVIHRGYLETLLRRKLWNDYATLIRYRFPAVKAIENYLVEQKEVELILLCLRLMNAGRSDEFFVHIPQFFAKYTRLDFAAMSRARSYQEILAALSKTRYQALLDQFDNEQVAPGHIPMTKIEHILYTDLYSRVLAFIEGTSGALRRELADLCGAYIDVQNVVRILRLKQYFQADPDTIRENLLPFGNTISKKVMEQMIRAQEPEEIWRLFFSTRVGRRIPRSSRSDTHNLEQSAVFYSARHYLRYSTHAMVTLLSYVFLSQTEVEDIINIVEGIRYGIPPDQIRPMLISASRQFQNPQQEHRR